MSSRLNYAARISLDDAKAQHVLDTSDLLRNMDPLDFTQYSVLSAQRSASTLGKTSIFKFTPIHPNQTNTKLFGLTRTQPNSECTVGGHAHSQLRTIDQLVKGFHRSPCFQAIMGYGR